jgi:hypothetical protein
LLSLFTTPGENKMTTRVTILPILLAIATLASPVHADVVEVTVDGTVDFNQIGASPLGDANAGDPVTITFQVDSDNFVNSPTFPTRGYVIDQMSFNMTLGAVTIGLENPFPAGTTPYFVLRDNDPAVDGFFVATSVDFPIGVPLDQAGIFGQFTSNYSVGYDGGTLSSLDILGALGTYDFTGLQVFGWSIDDGPFNAMGINFQQMTIESVSECFLVIGNTPGTSPFYEISHLFETQVGPVVEDSFAVLLDDIPEFVLSTPAATTRFGSLPGRASGATATVAGTGAGGVPPEWMLDGQFSVQIVMWNPQVFPGLPEQFTAALYVTVSPDGTVHTEPFGTSVGGLEIWHEIETNAAGETVIRFPFSIPGM